MNVRMDNVTVTMKDGKVTVLEQVNNILIDIS